MFNRLVATAEGREVTQQQQQQQQWCLVSAKTYTLST
jgi:hypothetical protein